MGLTSVALVALLVGWEQVTLERPMNPAHCILGTRTLFEALKRVGVESKVVTVEALAANREANGLIQRGIPCSEWPPSAWSVGAVTSAPGSGYPGHVVLVTTVDDGTFLLDSSTGQFRREAHGIMPPPTLMVEVPDPEWPTDSKVGVRFDTPGWSVSWRWAPELGNLHRSAPDWRKGRSDHVDRVLEVAGILPDS